MNEPRIFDVVEREETDIPVSELWADGKLSVIPEILNRGFFQIRLSRENLTVFAGQYIGLVPLNERITINVRPKLPIPRLLSVLGRCETKIKSLVSFPVGYEAATYRPLVFLEPIAITMISLLNTLREKGFLKEYRPTSSDHSPLRGRILFGRSLRRFWSKGLQHRAAVSFYDLTANVPANRVLKSAVEHLLRQFRFLPNKPKSLMRDLGDYQDLFAMMDIDNINPLTIPNFGRIHLGGTYREAVELAALIVRGHGVKLPATGNIRLPSFLLDMAEVFESYIRNALRIGLAPAFEVLDGNLEGKRPLYDEKPVPLATPDIVLSEAGRVMLVVDVKYKGAPSRDDINQILTYAVRYDVTKVLLLCLSSNDAGRLDQLGTISGIKVYLYAFSLAATSLDAEDAQLVSAVRDRILSP